jgi:hypothetical protein
MYCVNCGALCDATANFCTQCGHVNQSTPVSSGYNAERISQVHRENPRRYAIREFAESGSLIVVGSVRPDDARVEKLGSASFDFPLSIHTVVLCDSLTTAASQNILGALLYSQSPDDVEQFGPGHFEPLGAVQFNFQTADIEVYVLQDEPLLRAMIDGKRRSWREKHGH